MENKDKIITAEGLKVVYDSIINSPSFTGTPTAPTASTGTNTTQLATTAFVTNATTIVEQGSGNGISTITNTDGKIAVSKTSFAESSHKHDVTDLNKGANFARKMYLNTHPEDGNSNIIPFINNDIAFFIERGGTVESYTTSDTDYTALTLTKTADYSNSTLSHAFDGSGEYYYIRGLASTESLIIDLTIPESIAFDYTTKFYIDFGVWNWQAGTVALYLWNNNTSNSEQKYRLMNTQSDFGTAFFCQTSYDWYTDTDNTTVGGYGFNRVRLVLSNWYSTSTNYRISEIGIISYNSYGAHVTSMSRGSDDPVWRNITPNTDSLYDLGSSTNKWNNIYANNIIGTVTPSSLILSSPNGTQYQLSVNNDGILTTTKL